MHVSVTSFTCVLQALKRSGVNLTPNSDGHNYSSIPDKVMDFNF